MLIAQRVIFSDKSVALLYRPIVVVGLITCSRLQRLLEDAIRRLHLRPQAVHGFGTPVNPSFFRIHQAIAGLDPAVMSGNQLIDCIDRLLTRVASHEVVHGAIEFSQLLGYLPVAQLSGGFS